MDLCFNLIPCNGWVIWKWVGVFDILWDAGNLQGLRKEQVHEGLGFAIIGIDFSDEVIEVIDFQGGYAWVAPVSCGLFNVVIHCPYVASGGLF